MHFFHNPTGLTYFQKAKEAEARAQMVRQAVLTHEQLSKDSLLHQAGETNGDGQN